MAPTRDRGRGLARRSDGRDAAVIDASIAAGDRVAIFGRSGTGKTTLLRQLVARFPRGLALDPKRRLWLPGDWQPLEGVAATVHGWPTGWPRVISRPSLVEDQRTWLDACCRRAYQVGACVVAIDELAGIASAGQPITWLDVLQTRGRESGITTVIVSQRPRRIPLTVLSEAEHVFVFGLNTPADRAYIADTLGAYQAPRSAHGFLYWRPDMAAPVECDPLPI